MANMKIEQKREKEKMHIFKNNLKFIKTTR